MNDQRKVIYEQRAEIMDADHVSDVVEDFRAETMASGWSLRSCPEGTYPEQWDVEGLKDSVSEVLDLDPPLDTWLQEEEVEQTIIIERLQELADETMATKVEMRRTDTWIAGRKEFAAPDARPSLEGASGDARRVARQVIHLRSYAQKKPIDEYKQEAFLLFERLLVAIREDVTRLLMRAQSRSRTSRCRRWDCRISSRPHRPAVRR